MTNIHFDAPGDTRCTPPEHARRRRRSSDPYFALWSLCGSLAARGGVYAAVVLDEFHNVIASAGDADLAGAAIYASRSSTDDLELRTLVRQQARSLPGVDERIDTTRRLVDVSSDRGAFQVLLVTRPDGAWGDAADHAARAVRRILNERRSPSAEEPGD